MARIHSIGYDDRTPDELVEDLRRHERSLGNPPDNRAAFRRGDPAAQRSVALLCICRDNDTCHRSEVAEALVAADPSLEVVPIP